MISFNNIPNTKRIPGVYTEVDNSRALQGLSVNPYKALIIGTKLSTGTAEVETIQQISRDGLADGFFGVESETARMCNAFKAANPNTELHAIALSINAGNQANGLIKFDSGLSATAATTYYLMINGKTAYTTINSAWSVTDICSAVAGTVNSGTLVYPVVASVSASAAGSNHIVITARETGVNGNYINFRHNYYAGQEMPDGWSASGVKITSMASGTGAITLDDAWAVVTGEQYHIIAQPYIDSTNLTSLEGELEDRFLPENDIWGHGITAVRGTYASCVTLGTSRNSPHTTIIGANDSPVAPPEWAAVTAAVAAQYLNNDPARPLTGLKLKGILPPPQVNQFTPTERNTLLYDGIGTWTVDSGGNVLLERAITTYQKNSLDIADASYLDIQTMATLAEIRYQFKARMAARFIVPRFKLADDGFPALPGANIVTPAGVKDEIIALFAELQDNGLIENLQDFIDNLVVERNTTDKTRVDCLLPADLVNQFNLIAGKIQFIL